VAEQLRDLMTRLADEAGTVRDDPTLWRRARRSRQRRGWLAATAAAAVVLTVGVAAVVEEDGFQQPSPPGGAANSDTPKRHPDATVTLRESDTADLLEPGTYKVPLDGPGRPRVTVDLFGGFRWDRPAVFSQPAAGFAIGFWNADDLKVATGGCADAHETVQVKRPGRTLEDFAAALADTGRHGTDPVAVTLDGYDGLFVELRMPAASSCNPRSLWVVDKHRGPSADHLDPWSVDRIWIIDVGGYRLVIDLYYRLGTSANQRMILNEVVESTTITATREPQP